MISSPINLPLAAAAALLLTLCPAKATPSFVADYEDGTLHSGHPHLELQMAHEHSLQNVADRSREGQRSLKSHIRHGDYTHGGPRAEIFSGRMASTGTAIGETAFYGFSIYIEEGWQFDGDNEDILFQWYALRDPCENRHKSPPLFLAIKEEEWVLRINADPNPCTMDNKPPIRRQISLAPVERGKWFDCVVRVTWSYGEDGVVQLWARTSPSADYKLLSTYNGPNCYNDERPIWIKWGIYKPSWNSRQTTVAERTLWHDSIRIGKTFEDVMTP